MTFRASAVAVLLLSSMACSDPKGGTSGGAGDSGTGGSSAGTTSVGQAGADVSDAGGAGGGPAKPACNTIEADAPPYTLTTDPEPAPAATGGEIADGTYFATAQILYDTASPLTLELGSVKIVVAGDVWQEASTIGASSESHTTSEFSTTGTTLDLTRNCPTAAATESGEYSADSDGFTIYVVDRGESFGTVFTRQ